MGSDGDRVIRTPAMVQTIAPLMPARNPTRVMM